MRLILYVGTPPRLTLLPGNAGGHSGALAQVTVAPPGSDSRHPARVRHAWITIIALSVLVPAVLIPYGYDYNAQTTSTVGGPLTLGLCIVIAVGFDLLLWLCFRVFLIARSARNAEREVRDSPPGPI